AQQPDQPWEIPYLPLDPADVGRTYESVIRVNSQSGKGGIAFLLERDYGIVLPRRLQIEFSHVVQQVTDGTGKELTATEIWDIFRRTYLAPDAPYAYVSHQSITEGEGRGIVATVKIDGVERTLRGAGNGPIDAFVHALGLGLTVHNFEERSLGKGSDAKAVAYVEMAGPDGVVIHGVGIHADIVTASLKAIVSAANRLQATGAKKAAAA